MTSRIPDNGFPVYHYPGATSDGVVLVVAGLHTSEQSGVEVANWIRVKLAARPRPPRLSAIVIPEVFPGYGQTARQMEWIHWGDKWEEPGGSGNGKDHRSDTYRQYVYGGQELNPNRQFPPPGKPLSYLLDKSGNGRLKTFAGSPIGPNGGGSYPLLPQLKLLIELIETYRPAHIVSIHGIHKRSDKAEYGKNYSGVFVDPRYTLSEANIAKVIENEAAGVFGVEKYKFDLALDPAYPEEIRKDTSGNPIPKRFDSAFPPDGPKDDQLALDLATRAASINPDQKLVWGNHLHDTNGPPVVHYAREHGKSTDGYSLGDWGPVDVPGGRHGAPVFTIEPDRGFESWAFIDGVQYMAEDGVNKVTVPQRNPPRIIPAHFDAVRSKLLQAYAQAVIDILLK